MLFRATAQVLIRWALQRGTSVLPKSANPGRIASNFDVLDWRLTPENQQALSSLPYRVSRLLLAGQIDKIWFRCKRCILICCLKVCM